MVSILKRNDLSLRCGTNFSLSCSYCPEYDAILVWDTSNSQVYTSLIDILSWMVELERIDITYEVLMMSSYTDMPRESQ